jgi:lysophospholipase L1-like esterase
MTEAALARVLNPVPPTKPSSIKRLRELERTVPAKADLILFGDSLAAGWPSELLTDAAPGRRIFNFGLPGDRAQNTLWRIDNSPVAHLRPRTLILLVGTNNLGDGDPPDAVAVAIARTLERARTIWGGPHAILVTIPQRGEPPGFRDPERRRVNEALRHDLAQAGFVEIVDADLALALPDQRTATLSPDLLHISHEGYRQLSLSLAACLKLHDQRAASGAPNSR